MDYFRGSKCPHNIEIELRAIAHVLSTAHVTLYASLIKVLCVREVSIWAVDTERAVSIFEESQADDTSSLGSWLMGGGGRAATAQAQALQAAKASLAQKVK